MEHLYTVYVVFLFYGLNSCISETYIGSPLALGTIDQLDEFKLPRNR